VRGTPLGIPQGKAADVEPTVDAISAAWRLSTLYALAMRGDQCLAKGQSAVACGNFAVRKDLEAVFDEPRRQALEEV
jgi:hypothetical protein